MGSRIITIPRVPISMNQQERMNRFKWFREKQEWIHDIFFLVKEHGNALPLDLPHVWIEITVYFDIIRTRDESNYEPIIIKPLLDALICAKIIKNDTAEYVSRPGEVKIHIDRENPRTEVLIKWM